MSAVSSVSGEPRISGIQHTPDSACEPQPPRLLLSRRNEIVIGYMNRYGEALRWFLRMLVASSQEVEDLYQETFLRVLAVENLEAIHSPKSFILTTARNLVFDQRRRRRSSAVDESCELDEAAMAADNLDAEVQAIAWQKLRLLWEAIGRMPEQRRQVFILYKLENKSYADIAADLGLNIDAVRQHISRGLRDCRDYLEARI